LKTKKQIPDFLCIGIKLLDWYQINGRQLPFRTTREPYKIWICEIIFQQTRIEQGMSYYSEFVKRFPTVSTLANAHLDDVLLQWKGLGYYSRALNIHKAANQITDDFDGVFPEKYEDILKLKGVGKYTAAAISSICFEIQIPAIDGNYYRVLSRLFADDFDVSGSKAYDYFAELALSLMPEKAAGNFNQAIMDIGSEICKPKNPLCEDCPIKKFCLAFQTGKTSDFPVKTKKVKVENLSLVYFFVFYKDQFLIKQRGEDFIWKKLFEFPSTFENDIDSIEIDSVTINHKLTHKNISITINKIEISSEKDFIKYALENNFQVINKEESALKSFPKPLENYIEKFN
jgi:A/G-specific adenine glycosylase